MGHVAPEREAMFFRRLFVTLAAVIIATQAFAFDPLSGAFKAGTIGFGLSHAKNKANEVIDRAEKAGNAVVNNAAERALELIDAWAKTNTDLLDKAFDEIEQERIAWFSEVDNTISRLERNEEIIVKDLNDLSVKWSGIIKDLPFTDKTPTIYSHSPKVILPSGEDVIAVQIYGPRLGRSISSISLDGKDVPFDVVSDTQVFAKLDRRDLTFDPSKSVYHSLDVKYDENVFVFLSLSTWGGERIVERNLTLWMLPQKMGTVQVTSKIQTVGWDTKDLSRSIRVNGRDQQQATFIEIPDAEQEKGWILDRQRLAALHKAKKLRSGGGCTGLKANSMKNNGYVYLTQHGHNTDWKGHKRGVDVACRTIIPVKKKKTVNSEVKSDLIDIGWSADAFIPFPANQKRFSTAVQMFDGASYIVTPEANAPYGLIKITKSDEGLHFRPLPPKDF